MFSYKQNITVTEAFHAKPSGYVFHFCHRYAFKFFMAGFLSQIFIFSPIDWLKKSDESRPTERSPTAILDYVMLNSRTEEASSYIWACLISLKM